MSGLMGGGSSTPNTTRASGMDIQSSLYGSAIPLRYGRNRGTVNLIWYGDFTAREVETPVGGKGGGGSTSSYAYSTALAMCLGEGVISEIGDAWKGSVHYSRTPTPEQILTSEEELHTLPDSAPYTVRVAAEGDFSACLNVTYSDADRTPLTLVESSPNPGQYTFANGLLTFNAGDRNREVLITYQYAVPEMNQSVLARLGFELFNGSLGQAPWGYLMATHPDEALGYSGISYLACGSYDLGNSASLDNHSFEIQGRLAFSSTIPDCNPRDVVVDFLTAEQYGAGFPAARLGDLEEFSRYCIANGLFVSPHYTERVEAQQSISELCEAVNCVPLFSEGKLKIIPRGDDTVTGNGVTYTPDLTPLYDLDDEDFLGDDDDPVKVTRASQADAFNAVRVEIKNRDREYNPLPVDAKDQGNIELYGLRQEDTRSLSFITVASIGKTIAELRKQRKLYIRNTYEFKLGWRYCLLEPMDIVTLTDPGLGLDRAPVRITDIEEDEDGELTVKAEELPIGVASAGQYDTQPPSGTLANRDAPPGATRAPLIFVPPLALTGGKNEVWLATTGQSPDWGGAQVWVSFDGASYQQIGTLYTAARSGVLTAPLAAPTAEPDTNNVLSVALNSDRQLLSGSQADFENDVTLCYVGGELLAYQTADLTAAREYDLSRLRRGLYGTTPAAHPAGAPFARLDSAIFKYAPASSLIGKTIYLKLTSFNTYGNAGQHLNEVSAYSYTLQGGLPSGPENLSLQSPFVGTGFTAQWSPVSGAASYTVEVWSQGTRKRTVNTTATSFSYTLEDATSDGGPWRDFTLKVAAVANGQTSGYSQLNLDNPTPAAVTGIHTSATTTSITLDWSAIADVDLQDYQVWLSTTHGFTPGSSTLTYTGTATTTTITGLTTGTPYYLRIAARDKWGAASLNYSAQMTQATH